MCGMHVTVYLNGNNVVKGDGLAVVHAFGRHDRAIGEMRSMKSIYPNLGVHGSLRNNGCPEIRCLIFQLYKVVWYCCYLSWDVCYKYVCYKCVSQWDTCCYECKGGPRHMQRPQDHGG